MGEKIQKENVKTTIITNQWLNLKLTWDWQQTT